MNYAEFKKNLINTDPSKKCFDFLARRIADDNYRGIQLSQHNRYDMDMIIILLQEMYNLVKESQMAIYGSSRTHERDCLFSKDGSRLYFLSDRGDSIALFAKILLRNTDRERS